MCVVNKKTGKLWNNFCKTESETKVVHQIVQLGSCFFLRGNFQQDRLKLDVRWESRENRWQLFWDLTNLIPKTKLCKNTLTPIPK